MATLFPEAQVTIEPNHNAWDLTVQTPKHTLHVEVKTTSLNHLTKGDDKYWPFILVECRKYRELTADSAIPIYVQLAWDEERKCVVYDVLKISVIAKSGLQPKEMNLPITMSEQRNSVRSVYMVPRELSTRYLNDKRQQYEKN